VVYHGKLGTQGERVVRMRAIAHALGEKLGDKLSVAGLAERAETAAQIAKADLLTDMVGEFPELQGIMGRYYALNDGYDQDVAFAIEDHYKPRFAGDDLPRNLTGIVVALSDKLETLLGMFGIGQLPTGDRDPFALRRHALGVIRMITERELPLDLDATLITVFNFVDTIESLGFSAVKPEIGSRPGSGPAILDSNAPTKVADFIYERFAGMLREQGYTAQEIDAVLSLRPQRLADVSKRLVAVRAFTALAEAESLAAANKRVGNILKKTETHIALKVDPALFKETAEAALDQALRTVRPQADAAFERGDYAAALQALAALKQPVDAFFDSVMVNADDAVLRANRLGLLAELHQAMNRVADLSRLAG
jgi:glycyl-tRNA synthetase beta chain